MHVFEGKKLNFIFFSFPYFRVLPSRTVAVVLVVADSTHLTLLEHGWCLPLVNQMRLSSRGGEAQFKIKDLIARAEQQNECSCWVCNVWWLVVRCPFVTYAYCKP